VACYLISCVCKQSPLAIGKFCHMYLNAHGSLIRHAQLGFGVHTQQVHSAEMNKVL
jgi:hypothetical protein